MKTVPKGPFLGINNRLPDFALHVPKTGDFLRDGENIDIDDAGRIRRRAAAALVQAMSGAHSLYTATDGVRYLVRDAALYVVTLPTYSETLLKVMTSDDAMSYVEYGDSLYYSNGTDSGRVVAGATYPLGLPTPSAPGVTSVGGELFAGWYQVAVSYLNATTGEEGGVSPSSNYELTMDGGLRITLPAATPGATHIAVYVSTANGSVPMLAKTVAAGTATVDVVLQAELAVGREANPRFEKPLPAGRLFLFNGMLCSYKGSEIFEGIPYRPGYYVPVTERELEGGRIPFPEEVTNVVPNQNGVFVTADKTYWFAGTRMTKTEIVQDVLPYGGVPGTAFALPNKSIVGWFGKEGVVFGSPNGEVEAVMSDNISQTPPASGVSAIFTDRGYRRVVSCGWCVNLDNKAATRYTDYAFTSISGQYATKADGIYDLASTGLISYLIDLGRENFGTETFKSLPAIYLGVDCDVPMCLRVRTPSGNEYFYEARSCGGGLGIHRIDPGKGLRENWYDLALVQEADFTLASSSFAPVASNRRI